LSLMRMPVQMRPPPVAAIRKRSILLLWQYILYCRRRLHEQVERVMPIFSTGPALPCFAVFGNHRVDGCRSDIGEKLRTMNLKNLHH